MTSDTVLESIKAGNQRFLAGKTNQSPKDSLRKLKEFAQNGQLPKAIIVCCSDSRAPVEMIFDQDIGDLFVIRVAGNIIAPSVVGSVEFAAQTFGVPLVIVMGHTQCGAIQATLSHITDAQIITSENIHTIVSRIKPHIFAITLMTEKTQEEKEKLATLQNVLASVSQLSHSSRMIETLVLENKLKIVGSVLDLSTGEVEFLKI